MKRHNYIYLALSFFVLMVSCRKSELGESLPPDSKIRFSSSVEKTKAAATDIDALRAYGKFNVAVFVEDANNTHYFSTPVEYKNSVWDYTDTYYWTQDELTFYSYSPLDNNSDESDVNRIAINSPESLEDYSLTYSCPSDIDQQVDLLVKSRTNVAKPTDNSAVNLKLEHALSSIKFNVKFEDEKNVTLNAVKLNYMNIEKERTYNFKQENWIVPSDADKKFFSKDNNELQTAITFTADNNKTTTDIINNPIEFNIDNQLMIIPQQLSYTTKAAHYISVQISYNILTGQDATNYQIETGIMPLPAPIISGVAQNEYRKGEIYTYNIIVNGEKISFCAVSIDDQDDPMKAYGNIDLGLITEQKTKYEYEKAVESFSGKAPSGDGTSEVPHYYYNTAIRTATLLNDDVRDFVIVGSYGAGATGSNDGKLGYQGGESSPFFIAAESLDMMPPYTEKIDDQGHQIKVFNTSKRADGTFDIDGLNPANLISIDLRGACDFPPFTISSAVDDQIIPDFAFRNIATLDEVIFPMALKGIGEYAFENCVSLKIVDLAEVEHIEAGGFADCINLQSVISADDSPLNRIRNNAFVNCHNLEDIDIKNVTQIGSSGFANCYELADVDLTNIEILGAHSFDRCHSLRMKQGSTSPVFKQIEIFAFSECSKLGTIEPGETEIPLNLTQTTSIGEHAFNACPAIKLSSGDLNFLETIGNNAFAGCSHIGMGVDGQLFDVSIPLIKTIGASGFQNCSSLNIVSGLENLTTIERDVFNGCSSLKGNDQGIYLPKVTSVGAYAFSYCTSLETLSLPLLSDGNWGQEFFSSCSTLKNLSLPKLTKYSYYYENVIKAQWDPTSVIAMCGAAIETVDLRGILEIGNWDGFAGRANLHTVNLHSATSIGNGVFQNCSALKNLDLSSLTSVGVYCFQGCTSLEELILPKVLDFGADFINGNTSLKKLQMDELVKIDCSFKDQTDQTIFDIVKNIPTLEELILPSLQGTYIGGWHDFTDSNLTYIDLSSLDCFGGMVFEYSTTLKAIDLSSATSIDGQPFNHCTAIERIDLRGLVDTQAYDRLFWNSTFTGAEVWISEPQATKASGNNWAGITWGKIHVVGSDGTISDGVEFSLK